MYKSPSEMTPKERAVFAMKAYNNAYNDYIRQFENATAPFSADMVKYFKTYKSILQGAWPVISAYDALASTNTKPSNEDTQQLIDVIYQLEGVVKGALL